jgi:hypothetical protein
MSASSGARGAAVLADGCSTVLVAVDDDVLVVNEPHPASATPTTATIVGTAARMIFRFPGWVR